MSNLLKSKFLLGVMIVAVMFVGFVASTSTASAASCTITATLRVGSKGADVKCLQGALGLTADGSFGPKTKAAVMVWQKNAGLVADGILGAKGRAAFNGGTVVSTTPSGLPAGCTSTSGYSQSTGMSCSGVTTPVVQSGPVSAMLSSDNPASGYVINNQATADLLHFTLTGSGTVSSITLNRTGISNQNTLTNVYLFDGATRLTDGYSFNNTGALTMNSLGIMVSGSKVISVRADISSTAATDASTIGVNLASFTTTGNSPTVANLMGNTMYVGTGSPATVYLNAQTVTGTPTVNAGTSAYTVWSSPVQVNTRAIWLKGANFRMTGSAPADALQNIHLFVDGVDSGKTATATTITGSNYAMFDFSAAPISLSTGSHTVDVRADVVKGTSYTVTVSVQQAADLVLFDSQVGVNVAATTDNAHTTFTANTAGIITIAAGSASVVVDPTFQAMTNITGGATNTVIGRFKVHGYGEDVKVSSLLVKPLVSSGANASSDGHYTQLQNVALYFNGSQVGSSVAYTGSNLTFNLGSQLIIPAGVDSYIEVRADLQNDNSVSYTGGNVSVELNPAVALTGNGQGQTSHSTLTFPTSNVLGTSLTIQTGLLAVSKNTGYASQSANPNTANVKLGSYVLQNQSSSESVRVTSLLVNLQDKNAAALSASTLPVLTNFSNLKTSETSGSGATPIQPAASNTFSVNFTLAPGATKVIDVFADTSSYTHATNTVSTTLKVTSIGANSNVSINQNGGAGTAVTGQTITLSTGTVTNAPSILSTTTTASQYIAAANGGASNVAKATFNIAATGGAASISEMKFTVNSQDVSTTTADTDIQALGSKTVTVGARDGFAVGDVVQLVGATTTGLGIVTGGTGTGAGDLTIFVTIVSTGAPANVRMVPNTVTAVTVNGISAPVVSGVAYLTGLNLAVPNGGSGLNQDVFTSYSEVGTNGVVSGATSRIALEYVKYTSGGTTLTLCTAAMGSCGSSGGTIAVGGVAAPTMTLVGSSPTFSATKPSSTLGVANIEAIDVTVTSNAKGNVALNTLKVNLSANSACMFGRTHVTTACDTGNNTNTGAEIIVKDSNNQTVATTNSTITDSAGFSQSAGITITFTNGYTISGSQTFKIYVPVTSVYGTGVNGASLTAALATGSAALTWTDLAGNAAVSQAGANTASYPTTLIPSFPSTFSAVTYN